MFVCFVAVSSIIYLDAGTVTLGMWANPIDMEAQSKLNKAWKVCIIPVVFSIKNIGEHD